MKISTLFTYVLIATTGFIYANDSLEVTSQAVSSIEDTKASETVVINLAVKKACADTYAFLAENPESIDQALELFINALGQDDENTANAKEMLRAMLVVDIENIRAELNTVEEQQAKYATLANAVNETIEAAEQN